MEEQDSRGGAVRVGMVWGGIGGVLGFLSSILGSLVGIIVAGFVGVSVGKRAVAADEGRRSGALSGLIGGAVAAPAYALGAAAGALVGIRQIGSERIATMLSEMLGTQVSTEEAWWFFLASLVLAAVFQVVMLVGASTAVGAWSTRK